MGLVAYGAVQKGNPNVENTHGDDLSIRNKKMLTGGEPPKSYKDIVSGLKPYTAVIVSISAVEWGLKPFTN